MKYLTIIRHAKAEDAALWADDFLRPLTERGQRDARAAARVVESLQPPVDWWVTSPAARALETAELLLREAGRSVGSAQAHGLRQERGIYEAAPETLLALVRQAPPPQAHMVLVGHNPGLEALVSGLCSGAPGFNFRLPTAAVAHLELSVAHWEQVRWGCGELRLLIAPKVMKK